MSSNYQCSPRPRLKKRFHSHHSVGSVPRRCFRPRTDLFQELHHDFLKRCPSIQLVQKAFPEDVEDMSVIFTYCYCLSGRGDQAFLDCSFHPLRVKTGLGPTIRLDPFISCSSFRTEECKQIALSHRARCRGTESRGAVSWTQRTHGVPYQGHTVPLVRMQMGIGPLKEHGKYGNILVKKPLIPTAFSFY